MGTRLEIISEMWECGVGHPPPVSELANGSKRDRRAVTITNNGTFNYSAATLTAELTTNNGFFEVSRGGTRIVDGAFTNNGGLKASGTTVVFSGTFTNNDAYKSDLATNQLQDLIVGSTGYLTGGKGDAFAVSGGFQNSSVENSLWNTSAAEPDFTGSGSHLLDLAGEHGGGFIHNFAWGTLAIDSGNTLIWG